MATQRELDIMIAVWQELDGMVLTFGIPQYVEGTTPDSDVEKYFGASFNNAMREMRIASIDAVPENSKLEYILQNRTLYHSLRKFRYSASVFFKFSTATDGKSVDKTMIPKMLKEMMDDLDKEYSDYQSTAAGASDVWTIPNTINLDGDS